MQPPLPVPLDLCDLLDGWMIQLRGQRKSPHTLSGYGAAVRSYLKFCADEDIPAELTKGNVVAFMASSTCQTSTARLQLTVLKLFAKWLAVEEGFNADPVLAVKLPKADDRAVPDMSDDEVKRMIKACGDRSLRDKRDRAMLVLFTETGLRSAELLSLDVADVDVIGCSLHVVRGKGGRGRKVQFSTSCAALIDRYKRACRSAGLASDGPLFVAERTGRRLTYTGMVTTLKGRATDAGVVGFHVHRLRHSGAVRWVRAGGSESGLMSQFGWTSRTMIDRYIKAASQELAAEEFNRLGLALGDL